MPNSEHSLVKKLLDGELGRVFLDPRMEDDPNPVPEVEADELPPRELLQSDWNAARTFYEGFEVQGWTLQTRAEVFARERQLRTALEENKRLKDLLGEASKHLPERYFLELKKQIEAAVTGE